MFSTQAREGGVNLSIVKCYNKERERDHQELPLHSPLRESDSVFMDKFKMDQVMVRVRISVSKLWLELVSKLWLELVSGLG
jgi:hypothetical protein